MSRCQSLSDDQWALIEELLPVPTVKRGRPFRDARPVVEGIIYRYRCGIAGVMCPRCLERGTRSGPGIAG
ncbi:transposase [Mycobacterium sp. ITM-2016-00316]|uniref:transposase n=1 Tax=Mycobacterium sp. ITM-2016-00316 TaxID=2099695 RepID=UPI0037C7BEF1